MSGYEGCTHINAVIAVPAAREAEGDALFAKHKTWVQSTHGPMGLLFYIVTKNKELSVPPGSKQRAYWSHHLQPQRDLRLP